VLKASTFKSGCNAVVCVLGMAWLGVFFINGNKTTITNFTSGILPKVPWLLVIMVLVVAAFLYSQAATTKIFMPIALATAGISPIMAIAAFAATSGMFLLPTYPTMLAAVEFDDTGSTTTGKYIVDHSFFIPGVFTIAVSFILSLLMGHLVL
jgi:anaerobic C4-dicarboxylate transporter DcuA